MLGKGKGHRRPIETALGSEHQVATIHGCFCRYKVVKGHACGAGDPVVPKYYAVKTQIGTRDSAAFPVNNCTAEAGR